MRTSNDPQGSASARHDAADAPCDDVAARLVLGTAQLTMRYGVMARDDARAGASRGTALLRAAEGARIGALDTAPAYGDAEACIGSHGWQGAVHTKVTGGASPAASLRASLERLRRDAVDVLYLHDPAPLLRAERRVVDELVGLVGRGAGVAGVSVYDVDECEAAIAHPGIGAVQVPLNLLDRRFLPLLATAAAADMRTYVRSVFLQGTLLAPPERIPSHLDGLRPFVQRLRDIGAASGRSPIELALGWVAALPGVTGIIVGAQDADELVALTAAAGVALDEHELAALRDLDEPPRELTDPRRWTVAP